MFDVNEMSNKEKQKKKSDPLLLIPVPRLLLKLTQAGTLLPHLTEKKISQDMF